MFNPSKASPYLAISFFVCYLFLSYRYHHTLVFQRGLRKRNLRALQFRHEFYPGDRDPLPSDQINQNYIDENDDKATVSLVILALKDVVKLSNLLNSIVYKQQDDFEIIILDINCDPQTEHFIHNFDANEDRMNIKYSRQCHSQRYAEINNQAVEMASKSSKWILFLNENILLQGSTFINDILQLGESQRRAGAVGCKLLNRDGNEVIAAGNIIWSDGSASEFGSGNKYINSSELSYPRKVDYMSGACLMVKKDIILNYEGFDTHSFNDDYQVRDLQMYVQHVIGKDVWYQPQSVAFYDDNRSQIDIDEMTQGKSRHVFQDKWKNILTKYSLSPNLLSEDEKEVALLRASDRRTRGSNKVNILYIDELVPSVSMGAGFGRAFENLVMIASLGYKVTVLSTSGWVLDFCDEDCVRKVTEHSIEVVIEDNCKDFLDLRGSVYEVIIVSRPTTLRRTHTTLRELYKESPFTLIYDCEALWYRRDAKMISLLEKGINFPSINNNIDIKTRKRVTESNKHNEHLMLTMADMIVPVSEDESDLISEMYPNLQVEVIGPLSEKKDSRKNFDEREGILYLASFHDSMYYNGDAIWYFLKHVYPLVLKETPIPLTIAGREIPDKLRSFTTKRGLDKFVTFVESPKNVATLYEKARIFVVPHLYGAGVQVKLSEAMVHGIPTVTSGLSAASFRIDEESDISCVGKDIQSFKRCIIEVHNDKKKWKKIQKKGFDFIQKSLNGKLLRKKWSKLIKHGKTLFDKRKSKRTHKLCDEGEELYQREYPEVAELIEEGTYASAFKHWKHKGKELGRSYKCEDEDHPLFKVDLEKVPQMCPEGEALYLQMYHEMEEALEEEIYDSCYEHYDLFGFEEGRSYLCDDQLE